MPGHPREMIISRDVRMPLAEAAGRNTNPDADRKTPLSHGPKTKNKPGGFGGYSGIDEHAVRRIGFRRPEPRIEAEPCRTIGAEYRVLLAHVDIDVWVIERRRNADTVEFPDADSDLRDCAVVPELRIASAGHRLTLL